MSDATEFCAGRHAGLLLPLFSAVSRAGWGIGEFPISYPGALAAGGRPRLPAHAAGQRDARRPAIALLDADGDGHRPHLRAPRAGAGVRRARRRGGPPGRAARTAGRRPGGAAGGLRGRPRAQARRAPRLLRPLRGAARRSRHRPGARLRRIPRPVPGVARRLRALPRAARPLRRRRPGGTGRTGWPRAADGARPGANRAWRADEVRFYAYRCSGSPTTSGTRRATRHRRSLFGDLPFMVGADSADVWAAPGAFASRPLGRDAARRLQRRPARTGACPSTAGTSSSAATFAWLRARARRGTELYDGYRVDHVHRLLPHLRPCRGRHGTLHPGGRVRSTRSLGRRILTMFQQSGAGIVAEDLGTVPDFLRESLAELEVPGYKVFRWERDWHGAGQPFHDPSDYQAQSVATTGTHDTDALADWWDTAPPEERAAVLALPGLAAAGCPPPALRRSAARRLLTCSTSRDRTSCSAADPGRLRLARSRQRARRRSARRTGPGGSRSRSRR